LAASFILGPSRHLDPACRETYKQIDNRIEQHQKELPATTDLAEIECIHFATHSAREKALCDQKESL